MIKDLIKLFSQRKEVTDCDVKSVIENISQSQASSLSDFINALIHQQEKDRIVRNLTDSIRSSLDLNEMLRIAAEEVGSFLKAGRCAVVLYDHQTRLFKSGIDYIADSREFVISIDDIILSLNKIWHDKLIESKETLVVDSVEAEIGCHELKAVYKKNNIDSVVITPITNKEQVMGAFLIYQLKNSQYSEKERSLLKDISAQMGIAIKQAELFSLTKKQAERETLLRKIVETLNSAIEPEEIKRKLVTMVGQAFNADKCFIRLYDKKNELFMPITEDLEYLSSPELRAELFFEDAAEKFLIAEYKARKSFILPNLQDFKDLPPPLNIVINKLINHYRIMSNYCFPIFSEEEFVGAFVIHYKEPTYLDKDQVELLESIVNQSAIALKQAKLYYGAKKHAERETLLRKITGTIRSSLDINETLKIICDEMARTFNVERTAIVQFPAVDNLEKWIVRKEYKKDETIRGLPDTQDGIKTGFYNGNTVLGQQKNLVINNISESDTPDYYRRTYEEMGVKTLLIVPIKNENTLWGIVILSAYKHYRIWSENDVSLLEAIASQIYLAIEHADLYTTTIKLLEHEKLLRTLIGKAQTAKNIGNLKTEIVREIGVFFNADRCVIRLYDCEADSFLPINKFAEYRASESIHSIAGQLFSEFDSALKELCCKNEPIFIRNAQEPNSPSCDRINSCLIDKLGVKSGCGFPMFNNDNLIGIIALDFINDEKVLDDDTISFLKLLSNQVGMIIAQSKLHFALAEAAEKEKQNAKREKLLRTIIGTIRSSLDLEETLRIISMEVASMFNADRVQLVEFTNPKNWQEWKIRMDYEAVNNVILKNDCNLDCKAGEYWADLIFNQQRLAAIPDIEYSDISDSLKHNCKIWGVRAIAGVPIHRGDDIWGTLGIASNAPREWDQYELELLESISDQIYVAIKQASLYSQLQHALQVKDEFLANMSHEFRTPLNAIIGFSDMIMSGSYTLQEGKGRQYLQNISLSGKHLLDLVNDLLDISKIESGKMELLYSSFDSHEIIQSAVSSFEPMALQKNISLSLQLQEIAIWADQSRFRQIIYNLVSNAVKFTPDSGKISVSSSIIDGNIAVVVEDNGIGIDIDDHDKIFTKFKQIDQTYSKIQEGTGLGLALTKKLVELHGGSIMFESEKGSGAKFWFILPLKR